MCQLSVRESVLSARVFWAQREKFSLLKKLELMSFRFEVFVKLLEHHEICKSIYRRLPLWRTVAYPRLIERQAHKSDTSDPHIFCVFIHFIKLEPLSWYSFTSSSCVGMSHVSQLLLYAFRACPRYLRAQLFCLLSCIEGGRLCVPVYWAGGLNGAKLLKKREMKQKQLVDIFACSPTIYFPQPVTERSDVIQSALEKS